MAKIAAFHVLQFAMEWQFWLVPILSSPVTHPYRFRYVWRRQESNENGISCMFKRRYSLP
jgi:hypothetical protein